MRCREASGALIEYFTPGTTFDPPCSLMDERAKRVVELGSGRALASLHLAEQLRPDDRLVLTDLPNVVPLCEQRLQDWHRTSPWGAEVHVKPLAWGEDASEVVALGPFTHIILCDLVIHLRPHISPRC